MKTMDAAELVKQPQDVTENPYRCPAKDKTDKQKPSFSTTEEEVQYRACVTSKALILTHFPFVH